MSGIAELLERVKAATGPNLELERDIAVATGLACRKTGDASVEWNYNGRPANTFGVPPAYSASIDAALALVERCLPGWRGDIDTAPFDDGDLCGARLFPPGKITNVAGEGKTPPLAILAALLTALQSVDARV